MSGWWNSRRSGRRSSTPRTTDPFELLAPPFTLSQLRQLHQAVEGRPWQKDVFRRRVNGTVQDVGARTVVTTGRPAALLQRRVG